MRLAAEAEGLRLRLLTQRTAIRVLLVLLALVFLTATLAFLHIALWYWLREDHGWRPYWTALALGGGDLLFAAALALGAARSTPGRVEQEALEIRRQTMSSVAGGFAMTTMAVNVLRLATGLRRRR